MKRILAAILGRMEPRRMKNNCNAPGRGRTIIQGGYPGMAHGEGQGARIMRFPRIPQPAALAGPRATSWRRGGAGTGRSVSPVDDSASLGRADPFEGGERGVFGGEPEAAHEWRGQH